MKKITKSWLYDLIAALVLIVVGIVFISVPDAFAQTLGIVCGSICIVLGVFVAFFALVMPNFFMTSMFYMFFGIFCVMLGIMFFFSGDQLVNLIPLLFAIYLIGSGISKILESVNLHRITDRIWITTLVMGLIYLAGGIAMLFFLPQLKEITPIIVGINLFVVALSYLLDMYVKLRAKKAISKVEKVMLDELGLKPKQTVIDVEPVDTDEDK